MKIAFVLTLSSAAFSAAVQASAAEPRKATDAEARVPAPAYESAFKSYVPYREQELRGWREVNDEVADAGGHVGIFGGAHGAHAKPAPAIPASGEPAVRAQDAPAQPPARAAPKAPAIGPGNKAPAGGHGGH